MFSVYPIHTYLCLDGFNLPYFVAKPHIKTIVTDVLVHSGEAIKNVTSVNLAIVTSRSYAAHGRLLGGSLAEKVDHLARGCIT